MDLQSLTSEQLELTLRLSDMLSMEDLTVAAAVLSSFDWNIQNALSELQNEPIKNKFVHKFQPQGVDIDSNAYNYQVQENQDYLYEDDVQYDNKLIDQKKKYFEEQHASLFTLTKSLSEQGPELSSLQYHKDLANDSRAHRQDYLIALMKKSEIICKKIIESNPENKKKYNQNQRKIENNRKFINNLYTTYNPLINFTFGTFFLNLTRSYLQGKYLLVYIHSIAPETQQNFKNILELVLMEKEIANIVNKNCITYGMFDNSDDYEIIQKYIPLKQLPAFGLFRLSKSKKTEQFISSYNLSQKEIFLQWLASNIGIALSQHQLQGSHIVQQKKLKEEFKKKQEQKQKQAEMMANLLNQQQQYSNFSNERAHQDELYKQIEQTYYQKRQLSKEQKQVQKNNQLSLQKRIMDALKQLEPQNGENVIQIKFRMPSTGQSRTRRFLQTDKIEKAFCFVDCFCRDEFQQRFSDFDIMQTHPTIILSNFKGKTFGEIFEGSHKQNVIVRQK